MVTELDIKHCPSHSLIIIKGTREQIRQLQIDPNIANYLRENNSYIIVLPKEIEIQALSDKDLAELGLFRTTVQ